MEEDESSFADALKQAQNLGYAEADPTFDIEGVDTAHKIAILAAIAKGCAVKLDKMHIEGITKISLFDIKFAKEFGYKIKLLGVFEDLDNNTIKQAVYPCFISHKQNIANVNDSFNAILSLGNNCDWNLQIGRGAGSKTTASAIVADVVDIANNRFAMAFGAETNNLSEVKIVDPKEEIGSFYLRFVVSKSFAQDSDFIKETFGEKEVITQTSVEEIDEDNVIYGLITKKIKEEELLSYVDKMNSNNKASSVNWIRILEIN
jgi:homoserine dehydrogenase